VGNEPEEKWADVVASTVSAKLSKLRKGHFEKFPANWLSIYSNTPYDAVLHLDVGIKCLRQRLEQVWKEKPRFHAIFIEHGSQLTCISEQQVEVLRVHDIWGTEAPSNVE
jgi:hypothetical protein